MGPRLLAVLAFVSLVNAGTAVAADVPVTPIHTGDELAVSVRGEPTLSQHVVVMPDGSITIPLAGRLVVGGQTPPQAATTITAALAKYLRTPVVGVQLAKAGGTHVSVLGNVKKPGNYDITGATNVSDAISAAGGVDFVNGDLPAARVSRGDGTGASVDLQRALKGDRSADVALSDGAIVYVPGGQTFTVTVLGAVSRPGTVDVHVGDKLSSALARAGTDWRNYPDIMHIHLTRTTPDGQTTPYVVEFGDAIGGDSRYDPQLYRGDVVYVPRLKRPLPQGLAIFKFLDRVGQLGGQ